MTRFTLERFRARVNRDGKPFHLLPRLSLTGQLFSILEGYQLGTIKRGESVTVIYGRASTVVNESIVAHLLDIIEAIGNENAITFATFQGESFPIDSVKDIEYLFTCGNFVILQNGALGINLRLWGDIGGTD